MVEKKVNINCVITEHTKKVQKYIRYFCSFFTELATRTELVILTSYTCQKLFAKF